MIHHFLPFHKSIDLQRHRQQGQHQRAYGLLAPKSTLLPWQVYGLGNPTGELGVKLVSPVDDTTEHVFYGPVEYNTTGSKYWISYKANDDLAEEAQIPCGFWYFVVTTDEDTFYSEVIEIVEDTAVAPYVTVKATNGLDRNGSLYQTGFEHRAHFRGIVGRPKTDRKVEEEEDANGSVNVYTSRTELRGEVTLTDIPDYFIMPLIHGCDLSTVTMVVGVVEHQLKRAEVEITDYATDLSAAIISYTITEEITGCDENEILI